MCMKEHEMWPKIIQLLVTHFASFASIISLYLFYVPASARLFGWDWVIIFVSAFALGTGVFIELREQYRLEPKLYKSNEKFKIEKYMLKWLQKGSRCVIVSRDLSWANTKDTIEILYKKSRSTELTIFVEKHNDLTYSLLANGADIYEYGMFNTVPKTRFTIIDYGKDGCRVAVGYPTARGHAIREYGSGEHPFFALSDDFIKFMIAAYESKEHERIKKDEV